MPVVPVSVNLSPIDFQVADIFQEVDNIRQKHKTPAYFLNIEILESTLTSVPQQLHRDITKFHAAGYQIWIDDFGSGYSSLNNLKDFNFDLLKIGMTNLLSDPMIEPISQGIKLLSVPLALIERRDGKIKYCFINQAHHNSLEKFSLSMADWERFINEDEYSRKLLLQLMTDSKTSNQRISSHLDDQIYLEVKYLASYQTRDMFVVSTKNFNNYLDKTSKKQKAT